MEDELFDMGYWKAYNRHLVVDNSVENFKLVPLN